MFSVSLKSHNHQITAEAENYKPATSTSSLRNQETLLLRQRDQKLKSEENELEQKEGEYSV